MLAFLFSNKIYLLNFPTTKITPIPRKYWHRVGYKAFLDNKIAPVLGIMESATKPNTRKVLTTCYTKIILLNSPKIRFSLS